MSRVITFSRQFPGYHPKKGQPTFFVEKIFAGLADIVPSFEIPKDFVDWDWHEYYNCRSPKFHTIRAGNRWKVGDKFSPRVWGTDVNPKSGKSGPYHSKQIIIAPDIEVVKVWDIEVFWRGDFQEFVMPSAQTKTTIAELAKNDGLELKNLLSWFNKPMKGQVICWNNAIEY